MEIRELCSGLEAAENVSMVTITRTGERQQQTDRILREHLIDVYLNDTLAMKLVCTPQHLTELVLGRLKTEGIIRNTEEVDLIYICEEGRRARVLLNLASQAGEFQEITPTCCTGNRVLNGDYLIHRELNGVNPMHWDPEWIFALADRFSADTPLHRQTGAAHSCYLAQGSAVIFSCEDIGRHNALDKAVGYALMHHIPLDECILYTSGRVPIDMAEKIIRAGVPILCTKASPTAEAAALAKQYGLTLLGVRPQKIRIYTDGSRTNS